MINENFIKKSNFKIKARDLKNKYIIFCYIESETINICDKIRLYIIILILKI
jgi:hypothetical protein